MINTHHNFATNFWIEDRIAKNLRKMAHFFVSSVARVLSVTTPFAV